MTICSPTSRDIALALSGGGTRAMAFHTGVIRCLAADGLLDRVAHISSVSGGSLLVGLILKSSQWRWPTVEEYQDRSLPLIKHVLTANDLGIYALGRLIMPANWQYMLSRANVIADAIERLWSIDARLVDLPERPIWSVNATTSETGRRFRFKQTAVGDYQLGYANAADFKVAHAMAVSAAYPGIIGPLVIQTGNYEWRKRESWELPEQAEQLIVPRFGKIHLYDGGIYDNLGTEPFFDSGKQCAKEAADFIMVSDAGAPLEQVGPGWFRPFRLKRVADIISEQTRALRVRSFVNYLQNHPAGGAYVQLGASAEDRLRRYGHLNPAVSRALLREAWTTSADIARAAAYRTTLRQMTDEDFDLLERHGFETARWNLRLFQHKVLKPTVFNRG